mmetsp:Transcript_26840/g.51122  ORF Transcript_26840/g.51122 Transcript_26840/m.51122 type:complete len:546 (+) Transcript_26840:138-1775(+)
MAPVVTVSIDPAVPVDIIPHVPNDLSANFLSTVVKLAYRQNTMDITEVEIADAESGVLSRVVYVTATYSESSRALSLIELPEQFVAKFSIPEMPQTEMWAVEASFYRGRWAASPAIPFLRPKVVFTSPHLIILERVRNVRPFKCIDGCPSMYILPTVMRLARMHARCWGRKIHDLSDEPGIGSFVDGWTKQSVFPFTFPEWISQLDLEPYDKLRVQEICQDMCNRRLQDVHAALANGPQTLIHGDFHTENLLFLEGSGAGSRDRDLLRDAIMVSEGKIAPDAPPPATLSNSDTAELLGAESGDVATGPPPSPQWEVERVTKWPSEPHPNDGGDPGRVEHKQAVATRKAERRHLRSQRKARREAMQDFGHENLADSDEDKNPISDTIFDFPFDNRPTWLLDWAVAGQGSPLRDLVFFLVIGCTEEDREKFEEIALRAYHGELLQEGVTGFSWDECKRLYSQAVINQFLIVVVLHRLSDQLEASAPTDDKAISIREHLIEVNRRCAIAMVSHWEGDNIPRAKTEEERMLDQEAWHGVSWLEEEEDEN